jgi:hypothetical protein
MKTRCAKVLLALSLVTLALGLPETALSQKKAEVEVSLGRLHHGKILEPTGARITVRVRPLLFYVVLRNVSDKLVEVPVDNVFSFELVDEDGKKFEIKPKNAPPGGRSSVFMRLQPGTSRDVKVLLTPDEWVNLPDDETGKERTLRVRVIYDVGRFKKLYSKQYTVTLKGMER